VKAHTRHVALAVLIALLLFLIVGAVAARAQDYSQLSGAKLYERFCASCHGDTGRGDGAVAASFRIETPDLTRLTQRHGGVYPDEQVRRIIEGRKPVGAHGTRVMPVWGFEFYAQNEQHPDPARRTDEMVRRLAEHVRSLQSSKPSP
jgi:mono/diheme cytochrome c family protein